MQTIAGYNVTDVVKAAMTEKLHHLGAQNVNVDTVGNKVKVYFSTNAGRNRHGFEITAVDVGAANERSNAVDALTQVGHVDSVSDGQTSVDVLCDIRLELRAIRTAVESL